MRPATSPGSSSGDRWPAGKACSLAGVAALAGYFCWNAGLPPPPGIIPTVRAFQRAQGEVALAWLGRRLGLAAT